MPIQLTRRYVDDTFVPSKNQDELHSGCIKNWPYHLVKKWHCSEAILRISKRTEQAACTQESIVRMKNLLIAAIVVAAAIVSGAICGKLLLDNII